MRPAAEQMLITHPLLSFRWGRQKRTTMKGDVTLKSKGLVEPLAVGPGNLIRHRTAGVVHYYVYPSERLDGSGDEGLQLAVIPDIAGNCQRRRSKCLGLLGIGLDVAFPSWR